jgi:hypothetical protein
LDGLYKYERSSDELLRHVKNTTEGVDKVSILEILDGLYKYERSSDDLLRQVKKTERELTRQRPQEGDPGQPLRVREAIRWTSSPGIKNSEGVDEDSILKILDGLYE